LQAFLTDSSKEEIGDILGEPILIGGYHSSKALVEFCRTPDANTPGKYRGTYAYPMVI
jgi:hypothetical protein